MKKIPAILLALILLFGITSCSDKTNETDPAQTEETETAAPDIIVAEKGTDSEFVFVYDVEDDIMVDSYKKVRDAIKEKLGIMLRPFDHFGDEKPYEIVLGSDRREDCVALTSTLENGEYAIQSIQEDGKIKIIIAYKGDLAREYAVERFITEFIGEDSVMIPGNTFIKDKCPDYEAAIITSSIDRLRDPCILVEDGVYYAYGTGWVCYKNESGSLDGKWKNLGTVAQIPETASDNYWAPEVHKYNGEFYMFTTYKSSVTGHRGCTIMKSSSPEGPFIEITDGHITPSDWDSIDGTFYVDSDNQPWMIFVHEWTSTDDGIGRMAAAKLSDDLTEFVSEPIELFRADDPSWTDQQVTDGCWMYECEDGQLIMIWSNFEESGYAVGIARSDNGRVDGNWTQDDELLYSKTIAGTYDGGHGMIFTDTDGQMYLSIHSPNSAVNSRQEKPIFIPIREENGTLVWDLDE